MTMEILENKRNELFNRQEVRAKLSNLTTPSKEQAKQQISEQLNAKFVVIKKINSFFGAHDYIIEAYVYDNEEAMAKFEPRPKQKKEKTATQEKEQKK